MLLTLMTPPQYIIEAVSVFKHWFQLVASKKQLNHFASVLSMSLLELSLLLLIVVVHFLSRSRGPIGCSAKYVCQTYIMHILIPVNVTHGCELKVVTQTCHIHNQRSTKQQEISMKLKMYMYSCVYLYCLNLLQLHPVKRCSTVGASIFDFGNAY